MLTWTSSLPSKPGWYWWRGDDETCPMVKYVRLLNGMPYIEWAGGWERATEIGGEFSGPLPPPLEPPSEDHQ